MRSGLSRPLPPPPESGGAAVHGWFRVFFRKYMPKSIEKTHPDPAFP
jgi:hypothetical protein